ncbi:hypothetical protein [Parvibium lacunae]|uniref:hypothetical protein n=1 Tax=Parvibium lacunae TaxID=1888893 RepID=UPI0011C06F74|nr:hypothetical protein [Parvibium lacunae]
MVGGCLLPIECCLASANTEPLQRPYPAAGVRHTFPETRLGADPVYGTPRASRLPAHSPNSRMMDAYRPSGFTAEGRKGFRHQEISDYGASVLPPLPSRRHLSPDERHALRQSIRQAHQRRLERPAQPPVQAVIDTPELR